MSERSDAVKMRCVNNFANIIKTLAPGLTQIIDNGTKGSPCPVCCDGDNRASCMDDFETTGGIACRQCEGRVIGADIYDVLKRVNGWEFNQAVDEVERIVGGNNFQVNRVMKKIEPTDYSDQLKKLEKIWRETRLADGRVRRYLKFRGLSIEPPQTLRLHPALPYYEWDKEQEKAILRGNFPAIVSKYVTVDNRLTGLDYIYLSKDGDGKAPVETPKKNSKKCVSSMAGSFIRLYAVNNLSKRLVLCEGVETALAVRQSLPKLNLMNCPVWATGGTSGLRNIDLPESVEEVIIAVDKDRPDVKRGKVLGAGEEASLDLADRLVDKGIHVTLMKIIPQIPEGKDSLDCLDILSHNYSVSANGNSGSNN